MRDSSSDNPENTGSSSSSSNSSETVAHKSTTQAVTADPDAARTNLYEIFRNETGFETKARDALELGRQYLGVDSGHLTRIDQQTDHWEVVVSTGSSDGQLSSGLEVNVGQTYCRQTIADNTQLQLHNAPNQGWADDPAVETHGLACYHGTALVVNGESYGTVWFGAENPREPFSPDENTFTKLIAQLLERELEHKLEREQHQADLTRQSNLATVLSRVLRHNLKNSMSVIRGYTERISNELDDSAQSMASLNSIDELLELSETARELEEVVNTDFERKSVEITGLVESIVETVRTDYPNAAITLDREDTIAAEIKPSFERALRELIENAAKHTGDSATVTITVESVPNAVEVQVTDDGPGLNPNELEVLKTGSETPLVHGTGLGLWLAHWIVTSHGGSIEPTNIDDGTSLTVSVPRKSGIDAKEDPTQLRQARDQYKAAFEQARDAMVIVNGDGQIIDANSKAGQIYGLDSQALLGQPLARFFPEDINFTTFSQRPQEERTERDTMRLSPVDGSERTVEYSVADRIVPGQTLIVSRDVTERKERERELRKTKQRLNVALAGTNTGVWEWNIETDELLWNETTEQLFGLDPSTFDGTFDAFTQRVHPDDRERLESAVQSVINGDGQSEVEYRIQRDDGEQRTVLTRGTMSTNRESARMTGIITDITERKERERELRSLSDRYEALLDGAPDPVFLADTETGEILEANKAAETLTGKTKETLIGSHQSTLHPTENAELYREAFKRGVEGEETVQALSDGSQLELITADNGTIPIEISASKVLLPDGPVIFGVFRDTRLKQKNERLETVTSVLSHDLRNPLNVAQGRLGLLNEEVESEHISHIENAHDRIETLIKNMLTLTRAGDSVTNPQPVIFQELIESCWLTTDTADATLIMETEQTIQADESRLQQLVENLLRNAVEHGGDDVTITIGDLDNGFYLEDNGSGIGADERDQIFDSGYSTTTEGTGLGLSIVKRITEAHGWKISSTESDAGGARFEITGAEFDTE